MYVKSLFSLQRGSINLYKEQKKSIGQNYLCQFLKHFQYKWYHFKKDYCNDPKFLDRWVWANSADPDQTTVWSGTSLFAIPFASFWQNTLRFGLFVWTLGSLQQKFLLSKNLGALR